MDLANVIKADTDDVLNYANSINNGNLYTEDRIDNLIMRLSQEEVSDNARDALPNYLIELNAYNANVAVGNYKNKISYLIQLADDKRNPLSGEYSIPNNYDNVPNLVLSVSGAPAGGPVTPAGGPGATVTTVTPITPGATGGPGTTGGPGATVTPVTPAGGPGATVTTVTPVTPGAMVTPGAKVNPIATGNGATAKNAVQNKNQAAQAQDLKVILRFEGDNTYKVIEVKDKTDTDHILEREKLTQCFAYKSASAEAASSAPIVSMPVATTELVPTILPNSTFKPPSTFSTAREKLANLQANLKAKLPFGKKTDDGTAAGTGTNAVTNTVTNTAGTGTNAGTNAVTNTAGEETMNPMQANTGGKRKTKKRRITKKRNQRKRLGFKSRSNK
jgi:hypothetical protein